MLVILGVPVPIDPGTITLVQTTFLQHLNATFSVTATYALRMLYLFATLEIVIFGLVWALQRDVNWGKLLFKVLKISIIFFIIQNFPWLLNSIISSFAALSGIVISGGKAVAQYIFNPAIIWQYGYDAGLHLLQAATLSTNFGMVLIQVFLGGGILLVFGLLGIQVVLQVIAFYLVAFAGLILLPFGTFSPSSKMFDKTVQSVLQAGVRVMVLIIIIGIGVTVWDTFNLTEAAGGHIKISQPLGLFFTALLFLYLAIQAPKIVAASVGEISSNIFHEGVAPVVEVTKESSVASASTGQMVDFQAATAISTENVAASSAMGTVSGAAGMVNSGAGGGGSFTEVRGLSKGGRGESGVADASTTAKSISDKTITKIKEAVVKAIEKRD